MQLSSTLGVIACFAATMILADLSGPSDVTANLPVPSDWLSYGGAQYLFVMDAERRQDLSHAAAARTCRRLNSRLVSVDTDDEFELLKREIRQRVTATGQEFAHEHWWTAGRFVDQRWVWDKPGYPPVTVSALKRKSVPRNGLEYYLAITHGYDQHGWRLKPVPANYELRYICKKDKFSALMTSSEPGGDVNESRDPIQRLLGRTRGTAPPTASKSHVAVDVQLSKVVVVDVGWQDKRLQWNATVHGNVTKTVIPATAMWTPPIVLATTTDEQRPLSELETTQVVVTSQGTARLQANVQLCADCEAKSSLFPFDRLHCSIQLVLGSPATQLRQPASYATLWPAVDRRVRSRTSCSDTQMRRARPRCDVSVTSDVKNVTSSRLAADDVTSRCASYRFCLSRGLLYEAVLLLGPGACITAVLLTLLLTSPSLAAKLPGTMSVAVVSSLLVQFICSMTPANTLPVIVFYPLSLIAISVTSCCVGLTIRSRDCQTGTGNSSGCGPVTSSDRSTRDDHHDDSAATAAHQFRQMNCSASSSTLDRSGSIGGGGRRTRLPSAVPSPASTVNHVDQSRRHHHHQNVHYQTCIDASDAWNKLHDTSDATVASTTTTVDRRRASSPANSLGRSSSRSNIRYTRFHAGVAVPAAESLLAENHVVVSRHRAPRASSTPDKTSKDEGQRRLGRVERCVDMCLFVLLVLICVALSVFLVFMSF